MVFTHPFCMGEIIRLIRHSKHLSFLAIVTEQLYCNGKVIFLYNALSPPAKQVVFCFGHLHFSEHEKLQYPQQDKSHNKNGLPRIRTAAQGFELLR